MPLINGQVAEQVSVNDRGLLYGQNVFETISVSGQHLHLLDAHLKRLAKGCAVLGIPLDVMQLKAEITMACADLSTDIGSKSVLRVMVTMGSGGANERGYVNPVKPEAQRIITTVDYPALTPFCWQTGIHLGLSSVRLAQQPALAGIKHGNRLEQVIARSQWQDDWHEAILLDAQAHVIEATQSNVFIVKDRVLKTPDLSQSGVAGVIRDYVLKQTKISATKLGIDAQIVSLSVADIVAADEVFLTNSVIGLWPVKRFEQQSYKNFEISHKLLNILREDGAIPTF